MTTTTNEEYERVLVVTFFHDRPRAGIANFGGAPHAFDCVFDVIEDEYSDVYRLEPVEVEVVRLALEQEEIGLRWLAAYRRGEVALPSHPLPQDRERHQQLAAILKSALEVPQDCTLKAIGRFRSRQESPDEWVAEVSWQQVT
jgi:hypothetical protein